MNLFGILLSNTDLWLLAIAGACLAWLIPHRLAYWRECEARRVAACAKFQSTILSELVGLYPVPTEWPTNKLAIIEILEAKFPTLQAAVTEFVNALPWHKRYFFLKAWHIYRLGKDGRDIDHQYYWQYVPVSGEGYENGKHFKHDNRLTYQSSLKLNIDRLLSYAK